MRCIEHDLLDADGYGKASGQMAHRIAYGEIPVGFEIHHLCGNKACKYEGHLIAVSLDDHRKLHRVSGTEGPACSYGHEDDWSVNNRGEMYCRECARRNSKKYQGKDGR